MSAPDDLLADLDEQQAAAARSLRGPLCILAGAGTGKTRTLTHRIAYGIASGAFTPQRVMALTFTNRAAGEMRARLSALGVGSVSARTFHSAALAQVNYFWPTITRSAPPQVIAGKGAILGHVAEERGVRVDTAILRDVAAQIEWRKVSMISLEEYADTYAAARTPASLTTDQLVEMQREYERLKDERRLIDFEDVLLACAGMIEVEPSVALHVREQYRYFLVDEYQDVSPLQHHLLRVWLGQRTDICVVGDASQTIYSFAGASSHYLTDFPRDFPAATVVRLEDNYRSQPAIVDVANALVRGQRGALTLRAQTAPLSGDPAPSLREFADDRDEVDGVVAAIAAEIAAGRRPESIAVLFRFNAQSVLWEQGLRERSLAYTVRGSQRFFERPEVRQALLALKAAGVAASADPLFKTVSDVLRQLGWSMTPPESAGAVRERWESLNALISLLDEMPVGASVREFSAMLAQRQADAHEPTMSAVTVSTFHAAKGLEWDSVYLVGLAEGLLPVSYATDPESIEEERRLFYVGITRARKRLSLSWSRYGEALGARVMREPSRFLKDIRVPRHP